MLSQNDFERKIKIACDLENAICKKHTGKMTGLFSLSTSCLNNPECIDRMNKGVGVCARCYSAAQLKFQKSTRDKLLYNTELLTACVYDMEVLPVLNCFYFRFESFGDLNKGEKGINQFANYCNIARKNPFTKCALWTKNPWVINQAILQGVTIPDNLIIVFSVLALDYEVNENFIKLVKNAYPFIDKIFSVYTPKYIKANNIDINCGARSCLNCRQCYEKSADTVIREKLK